MIFWDTALSETHAFKLADYLVKQHNYLKIIYVSSEMTLSQDSLRHPAFRFLLKPLQYDDLKEALATFLSFQSEHQISLCFEQKQIRRVWLNEIIYVEARENQSEFYLVDNRTQPNGFGNSLFTSWTCHEFYRRMGNRLYGDLC